MVKVRIVDWNDPDLDVNCLGPLCDPFHLTPRNRARHRRILDLMLEGGRVDIARKILGAYPYLQDEYGERMARAVREDQDARRNW